MTINKNILMEEKLDRLEAELRALIKIVDAKLKEIEQTLANSRLK